jgi:hypothetical protein
MGFTMLGGVCGGCLMPPLGAMGSWLADEGMRTGGVAAKAHGEGFEGRLLDCTYTHGKTNYG